MTDFQDFVGVTCDSCNSGHAKKIIKIADYQIVQCDHCGLRYVNPQPTEGFFKRYYSRDYYDGGYEDGYKDYLGNEAEFAVDWEKRIDELEEMVDKNNLDRNILEIGCGPGMFLKRLADRGWKCTGIEFSDWASDYARNRLELNIITGDIFDFKSENDQFDVVIMWDTIEHLRKPRATLEEIRRILKQNGILQLTTGQVADLHELLAPGYSMWYVLPAHLFFYSKSAMRYLLETAGFKKIMITSSKLSFKSVIYLLIKKILHNMKHDKREIRATRGTLMKATALKT